MMELAANNNMAQDPDLSQLHNVRASCSILAHSEDAFEPVPGGDTSLIEANEVEDEGESQACVPTGSMLTPSVATYHVVDETRITRDDETRQGGSPSKNWNEEGV